MGRKNTEAVEPETEETAPLFDDKQEETEVIEPEVAMVNVAEEQALTVKAEASMIEQLQALPDFTEIERLVTQRAESLDRIRAAAMRRTNPEDWVLFKKEKDDPIENANGYLKGSGAKRVGEYYGVKIFNKRPVGDREGWEPHRVKDDHGNITYTGWCDALSRVNQMTVENLEVSISSVEDFTGRRTDKNGKIQPRGTEALEQDLRASLQTRLESKAIRILCAMTGVPARELKLAWDGTDKSLERCDKGHGFGTSSGRTAEKVAEAGVQDRAKVLWRDILKAVAGDEGAAGQILKEITRFKKTDGTGDFPGYDDYHRFTSLKYIESTEKRWQNHEMNPANEGGA